VWVDTPEPDSLAGLVLMPGTNAFTLDLTAWGPGEHTIRVELAQNDHTMYDPQTSASFTVTVSEEATAASPVAVSTAENAGMAGMEATPGATTAPVVTPESSP